MLSLSSFDFFKNKLFRKFFQKHYQSVKGFRSRSRPTIRVLTVYKGYQQTTNVSASKESQLSVFCVCFFFLENICCGNSREILEFVEYLSMTHL